MSALVQFSIFPTDKGDSVSKYVSKVIELIKNSGVKYQLNSMSTTIECDNLELALDLINQSYKILEPISDRVYISMNADIQKNKPNRIESKIKSISDKIGDIEI
ncbi:MAG: MTH1187 family thiamine-binding protein [Marinifilaceae bacterium]|jgi:uncharacterized protein (TIGR00106 family)|nr:MTH1187 family thiamine-binding protein [Marinifilaceae bacterium]